MHDGVPLTADAIAVTAVTYAIAVVAVTDAIAVVAVVAVIAVIPDDCNQAGDGRGDTGRTPAWRYGRPRGAASRCTRGGPGCTVWLVDVNRTRSGWEGRSG
ncbi:hypothetical protein ABZ484_20580 [Streptomyces sp. NPDC006393]|uniref:hypothetical protein n=1 Tax=Streptomyces sp. NPDC006393 TaxID=3156763 RepID=UPI0033D86C71